MILKFRTQIHARTKAMHAIFTAGLTGSRERNGTSGHVALENGKRPYIHLGRVKVAEQVHPMPVPVSPNKAGILVSSVTPSLSSMAANLAIKIDLLRVLKLKFSRVRSLDTAIPTIYGFPTAFLLNGV
jgi:hypothetical protein